MQREQGVSPSGFQHRSPQADNVIVCFRFPNRLCAGRADRNSCLLTLMTTSTLAAARDRRGTTVGDTASVSVRN